MARAAEAKEEEERLTREAEAKAAKKAAMAPDKDKLLALAENVRTIVLPTMKSDEGDQAVNRIIGAIANLANLITREADAL